MTTRLPVTLAACSVLALAACTDPAQLDPNANYTAGGAITGGIVGATAGLVTGGGAKSALIGGTVGAIAGGAIGNSMDKQAEALRASLSNDAISVTQQGDMLVVTMPQDILFNVDSTEVNATLQSDLAALAANLNQYPNSTAEVVGHTDNTGEATYNQDLSVRRATSVAAVITSNGVSPYRVSATGRGEDAPVASNLTPEGQAQNRRVDILIRETTS